MNYISIDGIYNKFQRDLKMSIHEVDLIEWTGEALEAIKAQRQFEEAIAFIQIRNFHAELPFGLQYIIQVAKNMKTDSFSSVENSSEITTLNNEEGTCPIELDCNGSPTSEYDLAYYRPYYDLKYEYDAWREHDIFARYYEPVRLKEHVFFNSIVCEGVEENQLYSGSKFEYNITDEGSVIRCNFENGLICIAYLRTVLDKNGIPKIPDTYSYKTAVIKYITLKMMETQFYNGDQGAGQRVQYAEKQWQWYCKQAKNELFIPQGIDEMQNLLNQMSYIIPRRNVYENFFGNLARKENKNILDTYRRNNSRYSRIVR